MEMSIESIRGKAGKREAGQEEGTYKDDREEDGGVCAVPQFG
jgi:hypothetical protein